MWQALHAEYEAAGVTVVTVALDVDTSKALPWIEAALPTHPSLIDNAHITNELFGFNNVPMAVWIDEEGNVVRPAESASLEARPKGGQIPSGIPERLAQAMAEVQKIPDIGAQYRAAVTDWFDKGAASEFALSPDRVIALSGPRGAAEAEAAAAFELGQHLRTTVGHEAAVPWWRQAHALDPHNWTYKRQAWTIETTPDGEPSDMFQPPTDTYESGWVEDVIRLGGGENYITKPAL